MNEDDDIRRDRIVREVRAWRDLLRKDREQLGPGPVVPIEDLYDADGLPA